MSLKIVNVGVGYYNSYLILGAKNILIDTVPKKYADELIKNISAHTDILNIDALIINHTESDRSGAVEHLLKINNNLEIIASLAGIKNLEQQLNFEFASVVAKSNMMYNIDDYTVRFIITHNINWPDSMMTYLEEEKILFSCDAFSDEGLSKKSYFLEKLYPMSLYVLNAMEQLKLIKISKILPGSGSAVEGCEIVNDYINWCKSTGKKNKVSIIFESHSDNTGKLAEFVNKKINSSELIDIQSTDDEIIYDKIYNSDGVIFATPTEYRNIPKRMREIILGINHYKTADILFASIGSYGWSGEAPNLIYSILKARHFNTFKSPFRIMFSPSSVDFEKLDEYLNDFLKQLN